MRCSSCQRSASESPRSTFSSSACASSSWRRARSSSMCRASIASSTSASARSCSTLKNPGPVANSSTSSLARSLYTRVDPAFSSATSGAWRASTPISPSAPGTTSISTSPSNAAPSGVTRETLNVRSAKTYDLRDRGFRLGLGLRLGLAFLGFLSLFGLLAGKLLRLLDGLLDRADHVEGLLGKVVVLALDDLLEALDRVLEFHVAALLARELLGHEVRLREEALDPAGTRDDDLVLVRELVDPEDGDDVLEVLVALQDLLDARRRLVVLVGDDPGLERAGVRLERIDRRVDPLLDDRTVEDRGRVQVRERVGRRRIGEVVRRHVDRLHRGDRARTRRCDALLQLAHLGRERRLVAHRARHPAEQRRHLRARLDEAEDVVDEEQHVLALIAEELRHRQAGEADAQSCARRLVHLAVDERDARQHARLLHLEPHVVALARALADAAEDRDALVLARDVVDQLLDEDGLADPRAAEQADLAALHVGRDQVDDLEAGLEDLGCRAEVLEVGRIAVDRPAVVRLDLLLDVVDRVAEHVEDAAEGRLADRHRDRRAGVDDVDAARDAVGRVHGHGADTVVAEMLLYLGDQVDRRAAVALGDLDPERGVDLGQVAGEHGVDDDALDLEHLADVAGAVCRLVVSHCSPGVVGRAAGGAASSACRPTGVYRSAWPPRPLGRRAAAARAPSPPGRRGRAFRRTRGRTTGARLDSMAGAASVTERE